MTFTWTKNVEKSSYHERDFLIIVENELSLASVSAKGIQTDYRRADGHQSDGMQDAFSRGLTRPETSF